jgi:hypothetical protein
MNWDALGAIAELLGAIAVFLTLAYLTVQVRQNSKALELQNQFSAAQIMQARTDTVMEFNNVVLGSERNLETMVKITNGLDKNHVVAMEQKEAARTRMMLTMTRSMFENIYEQHQAGFLSADFYFGSVVRNIETYAESWMNLDVPMSYEFKAEVKRILSEKGKAI